MGQPGVSDWEAIGPGDLIGAVTADPCSTRFASNVVTIRDAINFHLLRHRSVDNPAVSLSPGKEGSAKYICGGKNTLISPAARRLGPVLPDRVASLHAASRRAVSRLNDTGDLSRFDFQRVRHYYYRGGPINHRRIAGLAWSRRIRPPSIFSNGSRTYCQKINQWGGGCGGRGAGRGGG